MKAHRKCPQCIDSGYVSALMQVQDWIRQTFKHSKQIDDIIGKIVELAEDEPDALTEHPNDDCGTHDLDPKRDHGTSQLNKGRRNNGKSVQRVSKKNAVSNTGTNN